MHNLNNDKKKKNTILTAVKVFSLATIILVVAIGVTTPLTALYLLQSAEAFMDLNSLRTEPKAPMAVSQDGNNVYIV
jgi:hypothetical protein